MSNPEGSTKGSEQKPPLAKTVHPKGSTKGREAKNCKAQKFAPLKVPLKAVSQNRHCAEMTHPKGSTKETHSYL
ncbi:hypothetical protein [Endozoicomonas sp. ISHI1]|uniref:hypothetical protein n=1 Tax=Endozoicomonas sp. ISHI1 TaxID=2825882 RepID=UPI00214737FD|nr:hypothetical protein [Endozoicomonas sp. ISHI1]